MMNGRSPGFSLIEFLMVVVVATVIMTAVVQAMLTQQRGYRQQTAMVSARQSSRTVLDLLAVELREVSTRSAGMLAGDLLMAAPESIRFRAFRKVGLVCDLDPGMGVLRVVELGDVAFDNGDRLLAFQQEGDAWADGEVNNASSTSCGSEPARELQVGPLAANGVEIGAPVRGYEELGYGIFEIDDQWMLGRRDSDGTVVGLVGPLAEPGSHGLRFRYFDSAGNPLSAPLSAAAREQVARIEVVVKGVSHGAGAPGSEYTDSLSHQVYLRGN